MSGGKEETVWCDDCVKVGEKVKDVNSILLLNKQEIEYRWRVFLVAVDCKW